MMYLHVDVDSGHYRRPGNVSNLQVQQTFPFPPPSGIKGFVESLCGIYQSDPAKTRYAIGRVGGPWGHGLILRKAHVWCPDGVKINKKGDKKGEVGEGGEAIRPVSVDTIFKVSYQIGVDGELEALVRKALKGEVDRTGILYLGESDNLVYWLVEEERAAEWLIPGDKWPLPIKTQRGYDKVRPTYRTFGLSGAMPTPPSEAWLTLPS